uniref:Uncharacterized protein n=1 Tax=Arundo donax TaxID=35708 RepID=A0A0A8YEH2_ARUDO
MSTLGAEPSPPRDHKMGSSLGEASPDRLIDPLSNSG